MLSKQRNIVQKNNFKNKLRDKYRQKKNFITPTVIISTFYHHVSIEKFEKGLGIRAEVMRPIIGRVVEE